MNRTATYKAPTTQHHAPHTTFPHNKQTRSYYLYYILRVCICNQTIYNNSLIMNNINRTKDLLKYVVASTIYYYDHKFHTAYTARTSPFAQARSYRTTLFVRHVIVQCITSSSIAFSSVRGGVCE